MKKSRKNMLRSSAAMLLVSALALTTATYAWFTNGHAGKVDTFSLTAANAYGIELSADAKKWQGTITETDLTNASTSNHFTDSTAVSPLSSAGTVSSGKMTLYTCTVDSETLAVTSATTDDSNANLIRFDFYVRNSNAEDATLNLDLSANGASVKGTTADSKKSTGIEKAVRVAFIDQGNVTIDSGSDVTTLAGGSTALIWEPNSDNLETFAINGTISSGVYLGTKGIVERTYNSGSGTYSTPDYLKSQTTTKAAPSGQTYVSLVKIPKNSLSKVTVYVWLEGQDVDCTNNTAGGSMDINLIFTDGKSSSTAESTGSST
jgi:hypothetical protein